jgi:hypothetical protein
MRQRLLRGLHNSALSQLTGLYQIALTGVEMDHDKQTGKRLRKIHVGLEPADWKPLRRCGRGNGKDPYSGRGRHRLHSVRRTVVSITRTPLAIGAGKSHSGMDESCRGCFQEAEAIGRTDPAAEPDRRFAPLTSIQTT